MSGMSDLDLTIRAYHPNYLDYSLPGCPACSTDYQIIGFIAPNSFNMGCERCHEEKTFRLSFTSGFGLRWLKV
jgi:hypothetical protein